MRFKITKSVAGIVTTLSIDGDLIREGVAELEKACAAVDGPLDLDLSQLMKADAEAVRALKKLLGSGARLVAASPYFDLLLRTGKA